jgi:hypothetical protein
MKEERFFMNKTSLEMFDVFRAFGLGFLISGFEDTEVRIRDMGYYYQIDARGDIPKKVNPLLFEEKEEWRRIFRTFKERKDSKKKHPRKEVEDLLLKEYGQILKTHKKIDFLPKIGKSIEDGKTLYQTLDVSAAKGYREEKRSSYHEGTQLRVDKYSWVVSCIGAAWTSVWKESASFIVCMVPNPFDVLLISHRAIQNDLDKRVCAISANTALVHYSVRLTTLISERRWSHFVKYDSVIFNAMQKTGQQPKPGGGGKYSLNFLESLAESRQGILALKEIDRKFPLSPRIRGIQQDLALALTDFLLRPTLENFRTFERLYIRGQINKKLYPWNIQQLEAILKHVEIA